MTSPRQFFNSLKLSELDAESAAIIRDEILTDARLDILTADTDEFVKTKELIEEMYPASIGEVKAEMKVEKTAEAAHKPNKKLLQIRLKNLKEMLSDNPNNKLINSRIKNLNEMLSE